MKPLTFFITLLSLTSLVATNPVHADDDDAPPRTISVTGEGKAAATPDLAIVTSGVTTTAPTAGAALEANTAAMTGVMETLKANGIEEKDIQTSNFSVQPQYHHDPRSNDPPTIVAYQVSNNVRIRLRQIDHLGKLLDALVSAGSNDISGINFTIDHPEALQDQARKLAVANARARAELYAAAAGVSLGKVLTVSEQGNATPYPQPMQRMAFAMADAPGSAVPVAAGEQEVRATIHLVFAIAEE